MGSVRNICLMALVLANFASAKDCKKVTHSSCTVCPAHWYVECPSGYVHETYRSCGFLYWGCKLECVKKWKQSCSDCNKTCPTPRPTLEPTSDPTATPTSPPTRFPTVEPTYSPTETPTTLRPTVTPTLVPTTLPTLAPTSALEHCTNSCVGKLEEAELCINRGGCRSKCELICVSFDVNARHKCEDAYVDDWVALHSKH